MAVGLRKRVLLQSLAFLVLGAQAALAGNVGVNLNINVGEPPRPVVVAPPPPPQPVYVERPAYVAPPPTYVAPVETIRIDEDIQFLYPSALGFYVAVGVPYDLVFYQNSYYLYRDGRWMQAPTTRGPWVVQRYRDLPRALRRHKVERIRECRTREYVVYKRDPERYPGRHFRHEKERWKEQRREAKEMRKEERRLEKEERKEDRRLEKEARKEDKRYEKEARREEKWREKEERRERREGHRD